MRAKILIPVLVVLLGSQAQCAFDHPLGSVRAFGLAGGIDLRRPSPLDQFVNPGLDFVATFNAEGFWSRPFGVSEFELTGGAAAISLSSLNLGASVVQFSAGDYYWERSYLVSISRRMLAGWRFGVSASALRLEFGEGYRSLNLVALSIGTSGRVSENLKLGLSCLNFNRPRFDRALPPQPLEVVGSVYYRVTDRISIVATQRFREQTPARSSFAQEFRLLPEAALLLGLGTNPTEVSIGVSLSLSGIAFDYAMRDNVYLGGTHRVGIGYAR